jgi:3,4-dihydroxy 2-butanone 4-phosphate synthase/GTP cyclohydrolase II
MARRANLERFARRHKLVMLSVADLIRYRLESERLVRRLEEMRLSLPGLGDFVAVRYQTAVDGRQHVAFVKGAVGDGEPAMVRMHSACPLGDSGLYAGCDCGAQLKRSLERIAREGRGVLVYLQKGPAQRLGCIHTMAEERGREVRLREYGVGAQILRDLGITKIRLLTNNPKKIIGVQGYGLSVVERVPSEVEPTPENRAYLRRKRALGHLLSKPLRANHARKNHA